MHVGITGILVQTGKYEKGDEDKLKPYNEPDFIVPNFYDAVKLILEKYANEFDVVTRGKTLTTLATGINAARKVLAQDGL
jgi:hypothetical protein